jgi:hypothetical protein
MARRIQIALALLPFTAAAIFLSAQQPAPRQDVPLNDAQVRALIQRAIVMQHRSDEALDLYDRTERIIDRDRGEKPTDTTSRLVPIGASQMHVDLNRDGQPVPPAEIAQQWRTVLDVIEARIRHRDSPDVKKDYEKAARRNDYRSKLIDVIGDAFIFHWVGRTTRAGRTVVELDYEPNPNFNASVRFSGVYKQIWGKVWVDESSGYVVRLESELRHDVSIGGGIIAKVYQGATVILDQAEPFPGAGVWLPTSGSYDIEARVFVVPKSFHRKLYASDYRRIGPPAEALSLLRNEQAQLISAPQR